MQQSGFMFWRNAKVSQKLAFISIGFTVMIGAVVYFTVDGIREQKGDALIVDLAGRQRMLTHKYVKEVILTSQGEAAEYRATLKLFDETLEALVLGGQATEDMVTGRAVDLPPAGGDNAEARLINQRSLSAKLKQATEAFLQTTAIDPSRPDRLRDLLRLQDTLVQEANELTKLFSRASEAKLQRMIELEIALAIAAGVLGLLTSWAIARWIARPLAQCAEMAQSIAAGDLNLEKLPVTSRDETGKLSMAFDDMLESLRQIASQSRSVTENLNSAAAEILATTQQQASATKEQAAAVQQITSTVEEISQSSAQVSDRSKVVATAAQSMSMQGGAGLEAMRHTSRAMESIREQAENVAENVVALSEKTQAIGEIIATVNDIAEQSNLVALNAAIEAADAGEDGRRFAVVAQEIKNLADQAKEATGQVRSILEEIQKGINTSVMLTEEAVKRVEAGREKTQVAEQTIRKMAENIQENVSAFQQIVSATNQQQIGLEQVTQALHEIRTASQQTASSTRQLEEAASNVTTLGQQLRKVVEKYRL